MSRKGMFYFDEPNKSVPIAKLDRDVNQSTKVCVSSIYELKSPS